MTVLEQRYTVRKIDDPQGKHDNCRYFVLDPDHDQPSRRALLEYAEQVKDSNPQLANDLWAWLAALSVREGKFTLRDQPAETWEEGVRRGAAAIAKAMGVTADEAAATAAESVQQLELTDSDPVNHPQHYTSHPSGVECIQVVEHMGFNVGNAIKYLWRADLKGNAMEDLEKAAWYINREIERRKRGTDEAA